MTEEYEYDIFGKVTGSFSSIGNLYYFTGRRYDEETGLYYYRARMYSPQLGRFLQTDPIGYYAGMNLYTYINNNPVNWVDPLGLDKDKGAPGGEFPGGRWPPKKDTTPEKPKAGEEPKKGAPEDPTPEEPSRGPWEKTKRAIEWIIWWAGRIFYNIKASPYPDVYPPPPGRKPEEWHDYEPPIA